MRSAQPGAIAAATSDTNNDSHQPGSSSAPKDDRTQAYLKEKGVRALFKDMYREIVQRSPDEPCVHLKGFLEQRIGSQTASVTSSAKRPGAVEAEQKTTIASPQCRVESKLADSFKFVPLLSSCVSEGLR